MKSLGKVYQSVRGYEIADFEWACGWPLVFKSEDMATQALESMQIGASILITQETAPLHAEIARLQAENAKLRAGIKSLIEAQNRGIAANEPFNDAFYKGRVDSMWHTVKALETILAESEADNA